MSTTTNFGKISRPRYVVVKPPGGRKDGTYDVRFHVPARLRPASWPATIPLPRTGERRGDLTNAEEVARIAADAKQLLAELKAARQGRSAPVVHTLSALIEDWKTTWGDAGAEGAIGGRTRRQYTQISNTLAAWSKIAPVNNAHVKDITPVQIAQLLRIHADRPTTQRHLRATLATIMAHGVENSWREDNPVPKVKKRGRRGGKAKRKVPVVVWTQSDVDQHVQLALDADWAPGAAMILGLWESMARVSDAPLWRRGGHWDPVARTLIYDTSKSSEESTAVSYMSLRFAAIVALSSNDTLVVNPAGKAYRAVLDDTKIGRHFRALNKRAIAAGGRKLLLRHLRHSSQTHAQECGVPVDHMAVSTTHADPKIARDKYIQESLVIARQIAVKRGII